MRRFLRFIVTAFIALFAFVYGSYHYFGNDPAARLTLELDHDITIGAAKLRTEAKVQGCELMTTVSQIDANGDVTEGQILSIPIKALARALSDPGNGFIEFRLPVGQSAICTNLDATPCSKARRTEVQLNMPDVQTAVQSDRVLGWIKDLSDTCTP